MKCNEIRKLLPDLAAGIERATLDPGVGKHLASCDSCAADLSELKKTMALLDEWQAPEPSPYFDTRLQARLREELARPAAGWLSWLRQPSWPLSWSWSWSMPLAAVLFAGALAIGIGGKSIIYAPETIATKPPSLGLPVEPGSAVGDLQALERNDDLYADFDVLDDLQVQDDETENP